LLGVEQPSPNISGADWKELPEHREEGQVELDVNRSFIYYPTGAYDLAK
jgi:TBC1 domain family member 20